MVTPGQRWERITPAGDDFDSLVVCGFASHDEVAVRVAGGHEVLSADPRLLAETYRLVADAPAADAEPVLGETALAVWTRS